MNKTKHLLLFCTITLCFLGTSPSLSSSLSPEKIFEHLTPILPLPIVLIETIAQYCLILGPEPVIFIDNSNFFLDRGNEYPLEILFIHVIGRHPQKPKLPLCLAFRFEEGHQKALRLPSTWHPEQLLKGLIDSCRKIMHIGPPTQLSASLIPDSADASNNPVPYATNETINVFDTLSQCTIITQAANYPELPNIKEKSRILLAPCITHQDLAQLQRNLAKHLSICRSMLRGQLCPYKSSSYTKNEELYYNPHNISIIENHKKQKAAIEILLKRGLKDTQHVVYSKN